MKRCSADHIADVGVSTEVEEHFGNDDVRVVLRLNKARQVEWSSSVQIANVGVCAAVEEQSHGILVEMRTRARQMERCST